VEVASAEQAQVAYGRAGLGGVAADLAGLAATLLLDAMQREAGEAELVTYSASSIPLVVAAVSAATVGAVLAARRPGHPVGCCSASGCRSPPTTSPTPTPATGW
jgi:cation transporter-like permease